MSRCPVCDSPGAYIGFNSIECRNPQCEHFVYEQAATCPCCGRTDHTPEPAPADQDTAVLLGDPLAHSNSAGSNSADDDPTLHA